MLHGIFQNNQTQERKNNKKDEEEKTKTKDLSITAHLSHHPDCLFEQGQNLKVALSFHQSGLAHPVLAELLGHGHVRQHIQHLLGGATLCTDRKVQGSRYS